MSEKRPSEPSPEQPNAKRARSDTNGAAQPSMQPATAGGAPDAKSKVAEIQAKLAKAKAALEGPRLKAQLERLRQEKLRVCGCPYTWPRPMIDAGGSTSRTCQLLVVVYMTAWLC